MPMDSAKALSGDVQRLRPGRSEVRSRRRQGQRHRRGAAEDRRRAMRRSSRVATRAALTRPSCATGRWPARTWPRPRAAATRSAAAAWARRSTSVRRSTAYVLTDRGTWLSFKNRGDLAILVEGDKRLFNQYGVMVVSPAKHPHVKKDGAAVRRLGDIAGGQAPSPGTRSAASSCSSPTPADEARRAAAPGMPPGRGASASCRRRRRPRSARWRCTPPAACALPSMSWRGRSSRSTPSRSSRLSAHRACSRIASSPARRPRSSPRPTWSTPRRWSPPDVRLSVSAFARNALCVLAAPSFSLQGKSLALRLLDAEVRVGTSTPKADPSGDYAFSHVRPHRVERRRGPGLGGGTEGQGPAADRRPRLTRAAPGRGVYAELVAGGQADAFVTYCTNATASAASRLHCRCWPCRRPSTSRLAMAWRCPARRTPMRELTRSPLGPKGQAILGSHGFSPP